MVGTQEALDSAVILQRRWSDIMPRSEPFGQAFVVVRIVQSLGAQHLLIAQSCERCDGQMKSEACP